MWGTQVRSLIQDSTCYEEAKWSEVTQSCPTLCDPVDGSLPSSPVHGILQARILEWVAISFSRGSSRPRGRTPVSRIGGRHFNLWATRDGSQISQLLSLHSSAQKLQLELVLCSKRSHHSEKPSHSNKDKHDQKKKKKWSYNGGTLKHLIHRQETQDLSQSYFLLVLPLTKYEFSNPQ